MTKLYKVTAAVPFPVGQDEVHMYYRLEGSEVLRVGDTVSSDEGLPKPTSIDDVSSEREYQFYDMGVSQVMDALQGLLSGQDRSGKSQRQWQALKEQVWQLQDLAETCAELSKVDITGNRWWYRTDGETGKVVLFQLTGDERELVLEGDFGSDSEKNEFAKTFANLINLAQEAGQCLKARSIAEDLFCAIRSRVSTKGYKAED